MDRYSPLRILGAVICALLFGVLLAYAMNDPLATNCVIKGTC